LKILLTGCEGQLGRELQRALPPLGELVVTRRATLDMADPSALRNAVRNLRPWVIVNAAAYTRVERAEHDHGGALKVNAIAPGILAEEARRLGALLVHFSTDYVFDGAKAGAYLESDKPHPLNAYGQSKLAGDMAIESSGCRRLIARTSWVYAPRGQNFFVAIAERALAGQPLRVVGDQHGVPTEAHFLADMTAALIKSRFEGTINVVPAGATTWHGFAEAIVEALGLHTVVREIRSSEHASPVRRPANSLLDTTRLALQLGRAPEPWQRLLARCVREWTALQPRAQNA